MFTEVLPKETELMGKGFYIYVSLQY